MRIKDKKGNVVLTGGRLRGKYEKMGNIPC